jgi:hypothetical protein
MSEVIKLNNGVDYYNIDNKHITKDNLENIVELDSSFESGGYASLNYSTQGEAEPNAQVKIQAPTPPSEDTVLRMVTQIFYNEKANQKHKIKVRLNHTDNTSTEWIATMNKDARIFRRHNDLQLARGWIEATRREFTQEQGYKKPYYGKFHCHKDNTGTVLPGIQKEPECFASMAYNTVDESWYAMIAIYGWGGVYEYDYNFNQRQKEQGVRAQLVYTNPKLYKKGCGAITYAERMGLNK